MNSSTSFMKKYVGQSGSTAMLAAWNSAGVAAEMNMIILLHTGDKVRKQGDPPWL